MKDDGSQRHVPGATLSFTLTQVRNFYGPADWFPGDHPPMPGIVEQGRMEAMIQACGLCHYPNGKGRQENAGVAGLPYSYFVQTMADFKNGLRKSSDPRKANTNNMIRFAANMTDDEVEGCGDLFFLDEMDAVDPRGRDQQGAEDARAVRHVSEAGRQ